MFPDTFQGHTRAEWLNLIANVDATLKGRGVAVAANAKTPAAPKPEDLTKLSTAELWKRHAAIVDGAARTRFFRAHIKPRMF